MPRALIGALTALLVLLAPAPAAAHAVLMEAQPADGERLDQPPTELRLRFNEPVMPVAVRLLDPDGTEVQGTAVAVQGPTLIVRPPGPLPQGAYLLSYRVTSLDAHPVGASLRFGVGVDPVLEAVAPDARPAAAWIVVAARWLFYLTALGSAGLALFLVLVQPPTPVADRTARWLVRLALTGLGVTAVRLGVAGLELTGLPPADLATLAPWTAAARTTLSWASAVTMAGLLVLALATPDRLRLAMAGSLLVGVSLALTGHAATAPPRWLTGPALTLHALGGAFWLSALVPLLWSLRLPRPQARAVLARFSAVAMAAVALIALAGLVLAWVQLGGRLMALWQTAYGLRLSAKLGLVAGLLLIAGVNRFLLTPALEGSSTRTLPRLRRTLGVDLALGLGVLAVTASFPLDPPPRAISRTAAPAGITAVIAAPGGQAVVTLLPGRVGANRLEAWVTDSAGTPITAKEARILLSLPGAGIEPWRVLAAMPQPGVYTADGLFLPLAGRWRLRIELLIDDFTRQRLEGDLTLP